MGAGVAFPEAINALPEGGGDGLRVDEAFERVGIHNLPPFSAWNIHRDLWALRGGTGINVTGALRGMRGGMNLTRQHAEQLAQALNAGATQ